MKVRGNLYSRAQVFAYDESAKAHALSWLAHMPFTYVRIFGEKGNLELRWSRYEGFLGGTYYIDGERSIYVYLPCEQLSNWIESHVGDEVDIELTICSVHPINLKDYCDALQQYFPEIVVSFPVGYVIDTVFKIYLHPWAKYSENCTYKNDVLFVEITAPSFSYEPIYKYIPELFEKE